ERRRADAEETLGHVVVLVHRAAPDPFAALQLQAGQRSLRADRDYVFAGDGRRRSRPVTLAELIFILRRIRVAPMALAAGGIETLDDLFIADAMKQDQPVAGDDGTAIAFADLLAPEQRWAGFGPAE